MIIFPYSRMWRVAAAAMGALAIGACRDRSAEIERDHLRNEVARLKASQSNLNDIPRAIPPAPRPQSTADIDYELSVAKAVKFDAENQRHRAEAGAEQADYNARKKVAQSERDADEARRELEEERDRADEAERRTRMNDAFR